MEPIPRFRPITPAVAFVKLQKLVNEGASIEEMCKRINFNDLEVVRNLLALLSDRDNFFEAVEDINRDLRKRKSSFNACKVFEDLQAVEVLTPVTFQERKQIDWLKLPKHLIPEMMSYGTYLAGRRKDWAAFARKILHGKRKRMQIETILSLIERIVSPSDKRNYNWLDLCGGRGDLTLVLAYIFPNWSFTIMDRNKLGLLQASYRAERLGLRNVKVVEIDLFDLELQAKDRWDIVFGLHTCGSLTDVILAEFSSRCDHLFIATCCFGKMRNPHRFSKQADSDSGGTNTESSRLAKLVINSERGREFSGIRIIEVDQQSFSSKNQILYLGPS
jgi:hypothetical protein